MATTVHYRRSSLRDSPTISNQNNVDYALAALGEVEAQRDTALYHVEKLTEQVQNKESENAALRARVTATRPQTVIARPILQTISSKTEVPPTWLRGNWLTCGGDLARAEATFSAGNFRATIAMLDRLLEDPETDDNTTRLNAVLLKAKALSETGLQYQALPEVFGAKRLANRIGRTDLYAKSSFHEGICYYRQKNYQSALLSFSSAIGTPQHDEQIQVWREKTESVMFGQCDP